MSKIQCVHLDECTVSVNVLRALANKLSAKADDVNARAEAQGNDPTGRRLSGFAAGLCVAADVLRDVADNEGVAPDGI